MWHSEDFEKYEKQKELLNDDDSHFLKFFWSDVLIHIDSITTHFENPTYVNGEILNCTEIRIDDGCKFLINVPYVEFLKFLSQYEKPRTFSETVKLFND